MNHRVGAAALMAISVIFTLGFSELLYRFYRVTTPSTSLEESIPKRALNYIAQDRVHTRFDRQYGYTYAPNERVVKVKIREGYPVLCHPFRINAYGNTNHIKGKYDTAELKLLAFGDSFTANIHHDGFTWPTVLQEVLEAKLATSVHVRNFGRDSYGVLQMFDLAAGMVHAYQPDLVILAFITNDLHRDRFWRVQKIIEGQTHDFVTAKPTQQLAPSSSVEAMLIHPAISQSWCESLLATPQPDDLLLLELNRTFWQRKVEHDQKVDVDTLAHSFLFHRIVHRDPLFGVKRLSGIPRTALRDFSSDARMMENIETLNRTNIPYVLIHLPRFRELEAGRYLLNAQQRALRSSLEAATGKEIISVLKDVADATEDRAALFLLPHDAHPSLAGILQYAEAISKALIERGLIQ